MSNSNASRPQEFYTHVTLQHVQLLISTGDRTWTSFKETQDDNMYINEFIGMNVIWCHVNKRDMLRARWPCRALHHFSRVPPSNVSLEKHIHHPHRSLGKQDLLRCKTITEKLAVINLLLNRQQARGKEDIDVVSYRRLKIDSSFERVRKRPRSCCVMADVKWNTPACFVALFCWAFMKYYNPNSVQQRVSVFTGNRLWVVFLHGYVLCYCETGNNL